jgi:DNA-directed RNA polymerase subunit E'/Rpb7
MATIKVESKSSIKKKPNEIYMNTIITKRVNVPIKNVNKNIKNTLEKMISSEIEGKCIPEGYIKPASIKILTYSSGLIFGATIVFEVVLECRVCHPVEGMTIPCIVKNITKAGIRAQTDEEVSPVIIFIARDHHYMSQKFSNIKEGETINAKVLGQRFELNDKYISIIAELVELAEVLKIKKKKKKLIVSDE